MKDLSLLVMDWVLLLHGGTRFVMTGSLHANRSRVAHNDMECIGSLTCNGTQVQKACKSCVHKAFYLATRAQVCM